MLKFLFPASVNATFLIGLLSRSVVVAYTSHLSKAEATKFACCTWPCLINLFICSWHNLLTFYWGFLDSASLFPHVCRSSPFLCPCVNLLVLSCEFRNIPFSFIIGRTCLCCHVTSELYFLLSLLGRDCRKLVLIFL